MKITHVVLNYYPSVGGTQWLFQNISERLVKNYGDEVTVLTINSYYGPEKKNFKKIELVSETLNGVIIQRFNFARWHLVLLRVILKISYRLFKSHPEKIVQFLYGPNSSELKKAMINSNADVLCSSSSSYNFTQYPLWRKQVKNAKPYVCMGAIHFTENVKEAVISPTTLKAIKAADGYIANTQFEKDRLIGLGVEAKRIEVVGCGVEPLDYLKGDGILFRQQLGFDEADFIVGFVGRQEPLKNIDILIEAVKTARLKHKNIKLVIAGGHSWYTNQLTDSIIEANKNAPFIALMTSISEAEKINLYNGINLFASASASESFGIVFLEAWACKKPVVAVNIGAIASLISDKEDGLLVDANNVEAFSQAIIKLSDDKLLGQKLGKNGYQKMIANYTWDVVTEKYRHTYMKAIKRFYM